MEVIKYVWETISENKSLSDKSEVKSFSSKKLHGGRQMKIFFMNGYGASIVRHRFSYGNESGLFDSAVLRGDRINSDIAYDTPITDNVLGHLSEEEVFSYLRKIKDLEQTHQ